MTPATIVRGAVADGVILALSPVGTIIAKGASKLVHRWAPLIRQCKAEILVILKQQKHSSEARAFTFDAYDERAAIMQFDGGLSRGEAEEAAASSLASSDLEAQRRLH